MEHNMQSEKSIYHVRMENTTFEGVLDLSMPKKSINIPTGLQIAQNPIVPTTNEENVKISNAPSVPCSSKRYYSSVTAPGSSITLPHFNAYRDSTGSHVASNYNKISNAPSVPYSSNRYSSRATGSRSSSSTWSGSSSATGPGSSVTHPHFSAYGDSTASHVAFNYNKISNAPSVPYSSNRYSSRATGPLSSSATGSGSSSATGSGSSSATWSGSSITHPHFSAYGDSTASHVASNYNKISNAPSVPYSSNRYSSSATAPGSSITLPHFTAYGDSTAPHVASNYNTISNATCVPYSSKRCSSSATGSELSITHPHFTAYGDSTTSHVASNYNKIRNAPSVPCSSKKYSSSATWSGSSITLPYFRAYGDSTASHVASKYNNGSHSGASTRMQSFMGSQTEADLERERTPLFNQFKRKPTPYVNAVENAMKILSLASPNNNDVQIGYSSKRFSVSQAAFQKAVSKCKLRGATIALIECDKLLSKREKLRTTMGRPNISTATGHQLKPLDEDLLTALYNLLVDESKMVNIKRTDAHKTSSPDSLTHFEKRAVRKALSQYFNQLRQKEKKRRIKLNCHSDHSNQQHRDNK